MGSKIKIILILMISILIMVPFISAGFIDFYKRITGEATSDTVSLNITVTSGNAPQINIVYNETMTDLSSSGPNEGPLPTYVLINFSAYDANGYTNLDDSSALINFSKGGETTREVSCSRIIAESSGNYANYTCNVTMWWWDATGTWDIQAHIVDLNSNSGTNDSQTFSIGTTTGFVMAPTALTWASLNPGTTNQEPNENFLLNNTGNLVRNIEINATNLMGETDNEKIIYAENFSAHTAAGCEGTGMIENIFTDVSGSSLPLGNYTLGDTSGQEEIYICLEEVAADLSAQAYSSNEKGDWTVKIVA